MDSALPTTVPEADPVPFCGAVSRSEWIAEAAALGAAIHESARRTTDGSAVWLDPVTPQDKEGKPVRVGPWLYAGTAGVAYFLAALENTIAGSGHGALARRALSPLRQQISYLISSPKVSNRLSFRLGALNGLGGYIYSFARISQWLGEPELMTEACRVASLITPERIAADRSLDVMQGSAGAILALLLLEREAPASLRDEIGPLDRAVLCGEHLVRCRIAADGQSPAWSVNGHSPWCGFAHGATGIAYALAQLAEHTGREEFRQAAVEGLAFEDLHYDRARKNWRDLRATHPVFMTAWCSGAPGIALGRLRMPGSIGKDQMQKVREGLETTRDAPESDLDYLCCGNFGRAEVLLQASLTVGDPTLGRSAEEIATRAILRARKHRGYRWSYPEVISFTPALFNGAAGIGYSLLRLAFPEQLPCVLTLE